MTLPIVHVTGRIGRDPEEIETKNGNKLLKFSVAADRRKNDERGALWMNINVWNGLTGKMPLEKGSAVNVVGYLDMNTYTNKEGVQVTSPEVNATSVDFAMTGGSRQNDGNGNNNSGGGNSRRSNNNSNDGGGDWGGNDNEFEW